MAIVNYKKNALKLPTGNSFKLSEQYVLDAYKDEIIWDLNTYNCDTHDFTIL